MTALQDGFWPRPGDVLSPVELTVGPMIRRISAVNGAGVHRSGWVDCFFELSSIQTHLVIDDFVEQTLLERRHYHDRPFVGIFHYPPDSDLPLFVSDSHRSRYANLFSTPAWELSRPHLRACIVLSDHLGSWLGSLLGDVPVFTVKHPTATDVPHWEPAEYARHPTIVQIGAYYRNTRAIYRWPSEHHHRIRVLDTTSSWIKNWDATVARQLGDHTDVSVREIIRQSNAEYDKTLSGQVVLSEYLAASASNLLVECIARSTPILVNKHNAVEEYIGSAYPLFGDASKWGADELAERIVDAHLYLAAMEKEWTEYKSFRRVVSKLLASL